MPGLTEADHIWMVSPIPAVWAGKKSKPVSFAADGAHCSP